MATLREDAHGWVIQYVDTKEGTKARRTIRLGKLVERQARKIFGHVEALITSRTKGLPLAGDTAVWLRELSPFMAAKLARADLVGKPSRPTTLDAFVRDYIAGRRDLKESTRVSMGLARQRLVAFFPPDKPLADITVGDAKRWMIHLRETYAEATAARTLKRARQFFTAAEDDLLVPANPFDGIKPGSTDNPARLFIVTAEAAAKLVEAAPDADWRAIIALARFGGVRCPSEVLGLTWRDVDWDRGRFLVRASKTAHTKGGGLRWVPLFPELRPHLESLWTPEAGPDAPVITRYRDAKQNLRTTFEKVILRAGLTPWPRLFQNLRATRETELAARFPLYVVTAWMGNTEAVAAKHYLSVRDEDFAAALVREPGPAARCISGAEGDRNRVHAPEVSGEKSGGIQARSGACIPPHGRPMAPAGLEPARLAAQASKTCVAASYTTGPAPSV
jgi:integrase